jgi:hypothetical protein
MVVGFFHRGRGFVWLLVGLENSALCARASVELVTRRGHVGRWYSLYFELFPKTALLAMTLISEEDETASADIDLKQPLLGSFSKVGSI